MDSNKMQEKIKQKANKYKEQGFADSEFRGKIEDKNIVMTLPKNVFEQQRLLVLADEVLSPKYLKTSNSFETNADLEKKLLEDVSKYILVDGTELVDMIKSGSIALPYLLNYSLLYYVEILAPLQVWRDIIAEKMFI